MLAVFLMKLMGHIPQRNQRAQLEPSLCFLVKEDTPQQFVSSPYDSDQNFYLFLTTNNNSKSFLWRLFSSNAKSQLVGRIRIGFQGYFPVVIDISEIHGKDNHRVLSYGTHPILISQSTHPNRHFLDYSQSQCKSIGIEVQTQVNVLFLPYMF